jgi:hypothetical protein
MNAISTHLLHPLHHPLLSAFSWQAVVLALAENSSTRAPLRNNVLIMSPCEIEDTGSGFGRGVR